MILFKPFSKIKNLLYLALKDISQKIQMTRERKLKPAIVYYPRFKTQDELTNHYYRAAWYCPPQTSVLENVYFFCKRNKIITPTNPPPYMSSNYGHFSHLILKTGLSTFIKALLHSRLILVWKNYKPLIWKALKYLGFQAVHVDTQDLSAIEYGKYCGLYWHFLLSPEEKHRLLAENYQRFYNVAISIIEKDYARACIFGTGPSLEKTYEFDFSGCLSIVCNSIVQNQRLLGHIKPLFICAGDVVSHLGVSKYAQKFREDLLNVLFSKDSEAFFVTSAPFGYLFLLNHPEIKDKTILIDQTVPGPNFNLLHGFGLPLMDSTLNIHMLPLACTFTDEIFLLGCDGKSTKQDNEDFWAHAKSAQYHDLVDTGHLCHPTFDVHRQQKTYGGYTRSLDTFIITGEKDYGKSFFTLHPSNMEILKSRTVPSSLISPGESGKIAISQAFSESIIKSKQKFFEGCRGAVFQKSPSVSRRHNNASGITSNQTSGSGIAPQVINQAPSALFRNDMAIEKKNLNVEKPYIPDENQNGGIPFERDLPLRSALSRVSLSSEGALQINGWVLSQRLIDRILIYYDGNYLGITMLEYGTRPDVYRQYSQYTQHWLGFRFYGKIQQPPPESYIEVVFYSKGEILQKINKIAVTEK